MNQATFETLKPVNVRWIWATLILLVVVWAWLLWPDQMLATITFVLQSLIDVAPLILPGILITAWVAASGAGGHIKKAIEGKRILAIVTASLVGAVTPVCGVTVLPLMAGLLASGVPLAPVMAGWHVPACQIIHGWNGRLGRTGSLQSCLVHHVAKYLNFSQPYGATLPADNNFWPSCGLSPNL